MDSYGMPNSLLVGTRIKVAARFPEKSHVRTPYYVRGKTGTVLAVIGRYRDPEYLANGLRTAPIRTVYRVAFDSKVLWGIGAPEMPHTVTVDLYENWIEAWEVTA